VLENFSWIKRLGHKNNSLHRSLNGKQKKEKREGASPTQNSRG
jgi:hypothetical protein